MQSGALTLHARRRGPEEAVSGGPRLAVAAARRFPTAVARNRARRIIREAISVLLRDTQDPWDLVLVVRPEAVDLGYQDRLGSLAELLSRAGVMVGQEPFGLAQGKHAPAQQTGGVAGASSCPTAAP